MNWEALGAVAEGLGAVAVIMTLIYLVGQVRTSNRLLRSDSRRATFHAITQTGLSIADSRGLAELFEAGLRDPGTLDSSNQIRFRWMMLCVITPFILTHTDWALGLTADGDFAEMGKGYRGMLNSPGGRQWWQRNKEGFPESFVAFVEREFLKV